jgi:hypothetical protein
MLILTQGSQVNNLIMNLKVLDVQLWKTLKEICKTVRDGKDDKKWDWTKWKQDIGIKWEMRKMIVKETRIALCWQRTNGSWSLKRTAVSVCSIDWEWDVEMFLPPCHYQGQVLMECSFKAGGFPQTIKHLRKAASDQQWLYFRNRVLGIFFQCASIIVSPAASVILLGIIWMSPQEQQIPLLMQSETPGTFMRILSKRAECALEYYHFPKLNSITK